MLEKKEESPQGTILLASGAWTVESAASLWAELRPLLGQNLALDTSGIERIDSSGMQILLQGKYLNARQGKVFKLLNHSLPLLKALDVAGLLGTFKDPVRINYEQKQSLLLTYSRNRYSVYG
ncbi:MAG: STAS domain-containing protein [Leptospiraceae bacterium]|nr:STAS domain-containing protein [Leptospiraceae bacterium]